MSEYKIRILNKLRSLSDLFFLEVSCQFCLLDRKVRVTLCHGGEGGGNQEEYYRDDDDEG